MCSSRHLGNGVYEVTTPCSWASPGHLLGTCSDWKQFEREEREAMQWLADYRARLVLASPNGGRAWGEGIAVQPPDGALLEALQNGTVHESLVEEPRVAA
jgi:hypothetical protein